MGEQETTAGIAPRRGERIFRVIDGEGLQAQTANELIGDVANRAAEFITRRASAMPSGEAALALMAAELFRQIAS